MYCPKCKCEYRDGFTICSDCQVKLVEQLETPIESEPEEPFDANLEGCNPVKLTASSTGVDAQLILNLLKNNHIPCFIKRNGTGGYLNIYMGFSAFGNDIYVAERDYSKAMDLLKVMQPDEDQTDMEESTDEETEQPFDETQADDVEQKDVDDSENDYHLPFYRNPRVLVGIFIAIGVVIELFVILAKYF